MKRILFHSLTIPPDNVSTGMLVAELAAGFNENNIKVEILASTPQYNFEKSKPNNQGSAITLDPRQRKVI